MSEKTPQEVLELAQQRMRERREQEAVAENTQVVLRLEQERPWRYIFLAVVGGILAVLLLTPGMPLDQKMYAVLHGLCSQQHNIVLGGVHFPICARCSGIYISTVTTLAFLWFLGRKRAGRIPPLPITITLIVFIALMAIDGVNSMFEGRGQLYPSHNLLRTTTGLITGIGMAVLLLLMMNIALRRDVDMEQPIIANWRELGGALLIGFLVLVAIYGNVTVLAWPLAFLGFFGMIGVIFLVNTVLVGLFLGYDSSITRLVQLARPATIALIPTGLIIATFTVVRYWLEHRGSMH